MQAAQLNQFATLFAQAEPFLRQYQGKTFVVKYGGNAMESEPLKMAVMADLLALHQLGMRVVLVHGGGLDIAEALKQHGKESRFINGLRVTDDETMKIVQQVLAGQVNKNLVALLKGKAVGLSGLDGGLFQCQKWQGEADLGWVGEITQVNTQAVEMVLNAGFIPVIATLGGDAFGHIYNINADTAASELAIALKAEKLICMTDIAGVLRDCADPLTLFSHLTLAQVQQLIEEGVISGGMIPKIAGCTDCLKNGVASASIIDGRVPHALLSAFFSPEANGTQFLP